MLLTFVAEEFSGDSDEKVNTELNYYENKQNSWNK